MRRRDHLLHDRAARSLLEQRKAMEPIGTGELVRRVRNGEVTVIDVRPRQMEAAGMARGRRQRGRRDLPALR